MSSGANGLNVTFTDAQTYHSVGGSAGSFVITNASTANPILVLLDFQNSLYLMGSNWVATVSNLQLTGAPAVLAFQFSVLQSIVGPINIWAFQTLGTSIFTCHLD